MRRMNDEDFMQKLCGTGKIVGTSNCKNNQNIDIFQCLPGVTTNVARRQER